MCLVEPIIPWRVSFDTLRLRVGTTMADRANMPDPDELALRSALKANFADPGAMAVTRLSHKGGEASLADRMVLPPVGHC
jgi:hypothetical protein